MEWQEVCEHPQLQNLPFKLELDRWGNIIMSPAKSIHSVLQWEIQRRIYELIGNKGKIIPECPIQTRENVKVADVVWISPERFQQVRHEIAYSIAPELCVEVLSASNSRQEMLEKKALYFAAGAQEFWLCSAEGAMSFYDPVAQLATSRLFPEFPEHIEI